MLPEEFEAFFEALDGFVNDRQLRRRLSESAERIADTIDMYHMVATFHGLLSECLTSSVRRCDMWDMSRLPVTRCDRSSRESNGGDYPEVSRSAPLAINAFLHCSESRARTQGTNQRGGRCPLRAGSAR